MPYERRITQESGNGHERTVKATGKGTAMLDIEVDQDQNQRYELKDVPFVPEL